MELIKAYHKDLKAAKIVKSRFDQHQKIKSGKLRPPNKDGDSLQSAAWWWWADILEDLAREKAELEAKAAARARKPDEAA